MFTGLIERTGRVISLEKSEGAVVTLRVDPGLDFHREHGDSIAVNGICLSEVGPVNEGPLTFHVSPETLLRTSLNNLSPGSLVNLERSLRATDRLGGHIVTGHVDTCGVIRSIKPQSGFHEVAIMIPNEFSSYVVAKGSISIDGVSLTINSVSDEPDGCLLTFMIIPVTWQNTRFSQYRENDRVNIETDLIAKHVARLFKGHAPKN